MCQQLHVLRRRELIVERHQHPACIKNRICRQQPLRLIGHDDRRAITRLEVSILQSPRQGQRHLFEIRIGEAGLLPVAIGFDQAGFIGPAVDRVAQGSPQALILAEIEHQVNR